MYLKSDHTMTVPNELECTRLAQFFTRLPSPSAVSCNARCRWPHTTTRRSLSCRGRTLLLVAQGTSSGIRQFPPSMFFHYLSRDCATLDNHVPRCDHDHIREGFSRTRNFIIWCCCLVARLPSARVLSAESPVSHGYPSLIGGYAESTWSLSVASQACVHLFSREPYDSSRSWHSLSGPESRCTVRPHEWEVSKATAPQGSSARRPVG